ncbi:hypothetical protein SBY92_003778 [Candida maltosa Xu316]|uniref:Uncharacterized protein n=1 Tax=Candida maltosa (strain Xu316) TaxID=1245528 RepID=M3JD33_CANMX|nr:hypothetical protein G210_4919 [Candida maltosa Xu316]
MTDLKKIDSANESIRSTTSTLDSIKSKTKKLATKLKGKPAAERKMTQMEAMTTYLALRS